MPNYTGAVFVLDFTGLYFSVAGCAHAASADRNSDHPLVYRRFRFFAYEPSLFLKENYGFVKEVSSKYVGSERVEWPHRGSMCAGRENVCEEVCPAVFRRDT